MRPRSFFKVGKVFKILWPDPTGAGAAAITMGTLPSNTDSGAHIRWFVVIRDEEEYSSCLPIQTNGGRGCAGLKKDHHAIIYTGRDAPKQMDHEKPAKGEEGMKTAIRVKPKSNTDQIDPKARVNFVKIYTIEYNVKIYDVGEVHADSMKRFHRHFRECWGIDDETVARARMLKKALKAAQSQQQEEEEEDSDLESDESENESDDGPATDPHYEANTVNNYVIEFARQWRERGEDQKAEWILRLSYEEQKGYLRQQGLYPSSQSSQSVRQGKQPKQQEKKSRRSRKR